MPNHIDNKLTVLGPESTVAAVVARTHAPIQQFPPQWEGDKTTKETVAFSFHAFVPIPADVLARQYSGEPGQDGRCGYDWEHELWGVKWGAYDSEVVNREVGHVTYKFQTAWAMADVFFSRFSALYPDCTVVVSYGGEGPARGWCVWRGGVVVDSRDDSPDEIVTPDLPEDAGEVEETAWQETCDKVVNLYLDDHRARALHFGLVPVFAESNGLYEMARRNDGESSDGTSSRHVLRDWLEERGVLISDADLAAVLAFCP
jgi:hypothetical protein